ncbi:MAG: alpha/beta fold hydrolase [Pseudomonadota bacterium]
MRGAVVASLLMLAGCAGVPGAQVPRFEEVAGDDAGFPVAVPATFQSVRGYLIVEEAPRGREIRLPVVVVKARDPSAGYPPVVRFAGGPGLSGLSAAAYPGAYPWTADRDFIILGQRGTEGAEPALVCTEYRGALGADLSDRVAAAEVCRARYEDAGAVLSAYHTAASARDVEALRVVLGIEKLSLYGGSYGTRLALTYARDFPDRVESMVLDSPLPHDVSYDDESPGNLRDALAAIGTACAEDVACARDYPRVFERFLVALDAARADPWQLMAADGSSVTLSAADFVGLVGIEGPRSIVRAPRMMDAIARRDAEIIRPLIGGATVSSPFAWGMRLSVWCSEDLPFSRRAEGPLEENFAGLDGAVVPPEVCAVWGVPPRPRAEKAATVSSIPTLIIAGTFDPLTPPRWADHAAKTLARSHVAIVPFGGHVETNNWSGDGCAMAIAAAFFADEEAFLADPSDATACLAAQEPPDFIRR